jgi:hypothetical protein
MVIILSGGMAKGLPESMFQEGRNMLNHKVFLIPAILPLFGARVSL